MSAYLELREAFEAIAGAGDQVGFSTITLAEIIYLIEKDRIPASALSRLVDALDDPAVVLTDLPFDRFVAVSLSSIEREKIPDLPDRIIAATALRHDVLVISWDRWITASHLETIW